MRWRHSTASVPSPHVRHGTDARTHGAAQHVTRVLSWWFRAAYPTRGAAGGAFLFEALLAVHLRVDAVPAPRVRPSTRAQRCQCYYVGRQAQSHSQAWARSAAGQLSVPQAGHGARAGAAWRRRRTRTSTQTRRPSCPESIGWRRPPCRPSPAPPPGRDGAVRGSTCGATSASQDQRLVTAVGRAGGRAGMLGTGPPAAPLPLSSHGCARWPARRSDELRTLSSNAAKYAVTCLLGAAVEAGGRVRAAAVVWLVF